MFQVAVTRVTQGHMLPGRSRTSICVWKTEDMQSLKLKVSTKNSLLGMKHNSNWKNKKVHTHG